MTDIETRSGVNGTGQPFVTIHWGEMSGQFTVEEARQFGLIVLETAEAAEHDALFWSWLLENFGDVPIGKRATMLADLRNHRERLEKAREREEP